MMNAFEVRQLLRPLRSVTAPRVRLVCAPYAGAAATLFHAWPDGLPDDVELRAVQLPARHDRLREAPMTRVAPIVDRIASALAALPPVPTVLFGHSFGGLVVFELARRLQQSGAPPAALVVSARRAPHLRPMHTPIHRLPEPAFLEVLHRHYGTSMEVLRNRDVIELALPPLRADFEALETYAYSSTEPLDVPLTVLRGGRDSTVPAADAVAWGEVVASSVALHEVDGGHFFVDTHRRWVLERINEVIAVVSALDRATKRAAS